MLFMMLESRYVFKGPHGPSIQQLFTIQISFSPENLNLKNAVLR